MDVRKKIEDQKKWIESCGGDLDGYIANYCGKYGRSKENATAIYNADLRELRLWEKALAGNVWRQVPLSVVSAAEQDTYDNTDNPVILEWAKQVFASRGVHWHQTHWRYFPERTTKP